MGGTHNAEEARCNGRGAVCAELRTRTKGSGQHREMWCTLPGKWRTAHWQRKGFWQGSVSRDWEEVSFQLGTHNKQLVLSVATNNQWNSTQPPGPRHLQLALLPTPPGFQTQTKLSECYRKDGWTSDRQILALPLALPWMGSETLNKRPTASHFRRRVGQVALGGLLYH